MGFEPFLLYIRPCCFLLQCSLIPFFSANLSSMASLNPEPVSISSNGIDQDNALQKHVAFFDRNHDGIVYPWETYKGFRAIGSGVALSVISALFINGFLSHKSSPKKLPSLLFPIYVKNINKCKHGSDTEVYDSRGRFLPSKFEEIFAKHAVKNANALTGEELSMMLKANREPKDCSGWLGSWTEWKILYSLCKDKDGLLHKETLRAVYDGSLFERMEGEAASRRQSVQSRV